MFWSSVDTGGGIKPYPIPTRVSSFEHVVRIRDPSKGTGPIQNYVTSLKDMMRRIGLSTEGRIEETMDVEGGNIVSELTVEEVLMPGVCQRIRDDQDLMNQFYDGVKWGAMTRRISEMLPQDLVDVGQRAYGMVAPVMNDLFGEQYKGWRTERRGEHNTLFIVRIRPDEP